MNYETADDGFITTVDDILSHASRENENSAISEDGEVTPILIRRALQEVYAIKTNRMRINKKQVQAYRGLKLKHVSQQSSVGMESPTDEWQTLVLHAKEIDKGKWNVAKSTNTFVVYILGSHCLFVSLTYFDYPWLLHCLFLLIIRLTLFYSRLDIFQSGFRENTC